MNNFTMIRKRTGMLMIYLLILAGILIAMGTMTVHAEDKTPINVKVVFTIDNKVVPSSMINEDSSKYLEAVYITKLVALDGTAASQKIIDDSGAHLVLSSGTSVKNPLIFSGLASTDYSFDAAIPSLLNQYTIECTNTLPTGYYLNYWYERGVTPVYGTDFEANHPSFANNGNTTVPDVTKQERLISTTETYIQTCLKTQLPANVSGHDAVFGVTNGKTYGSWLIFTAARAGYTPHDGFNAECFAAFEQKYKDSEKVDSAGKPLNEGFDANDVAKDALAITAMGYDARNVAGYNLIEMLTNGKNPSDGYFVGQVSEFAIDSYQYLPGQEASYIHDLAAKALTGTVTHSDPLIDMYVMEFQPIAAYYDPNAKEGDQFYDVKQAMEKVFIPYFSAHQGYTGLLYSGISYNNPWSNAQSFIMLGMGNVNLFQTSFIKNGYTMLDILLATTESFSADEGQIARGYEALVRSYRGEKQIFDCTDMVNSTVKVNNAIVALPAVDTITSNNKEAAQTALNNVDKVLTSLTLTDSQKSSIDMTKYNAVKAKLGTQIPVVTPVNCIYQTHVENIGWQDLKTNGDMSGTQGQSLRLEGIKISLNTAANLEIQYQTHIENIGWEDAWKSNGDLSGTTGRSLRLEAIRIQLTGDDADNYDIYYQVHAQNVGWMGWAKNGENAGTAGFSYRLEGIKIVVVPKGEAAPTTTIDNDQAFISNNS